MHSSDLSQTLVEATILFTHVIMASQMCNKLLAMATYKTVVLQWHHSVCTVNIAYIMGQHMIGYLIFSNIIKINKCNIIDTQIAICSIGEDLLVYCSRHDAEILAHTRSA